MFTQTTVDRFVGGKGYIVLSEWLHQEHNGVEHNANMRNGDQWFFLELKKTIFFL